MTTITTSISISLEDKEFLDNNSDLSPSKLLRAKICEVRESRSGVKAELISSQENNKKLSIIIKELGDKIYVLENKK